MNQLTHRRCKNRLWWILLITCLPACEQQLKPEAAVVRPETPPTPPPPLPAQKTYVSGLAWMFKPGDSCVAIASGKVVTLTISATASTVNWRLQGRLLNQVKQSRMPIRFLAKNAFWTILARRAPGGQLAASVPLSEKEAARVLVLLGGGTLEAGVGTGAFTVRLPAAGQEGVDWFACVRGRLLPVPTVP